MESRLLQPLLSPSFNNKHHHSQTLSHPLTLTLDPQLPMLPLLDQQEKEIHLLEQEVQEEVQEVLQEQTLVIRIGVSG